jgi:hypothetical protein
MRAHDHFFHRTLDASAPLLLWALHFFVAYIFSAAACDTRLAKVSWYGQPAIWLILVAWTAIMFAAIAWLLWRAAHRRSSAQRLLPDARFGCAILATVGVVWTTVPMFIVSVCTK